MIEGVTEICDRLVPNWRKLTWLLAVSNSGIVDDFTDELHVMMFDAVKDMRALRAFCDPEAKPRDKMATVTQMNDAVEASNLPDAQKKRIGARMLVIRLRHLPIFSLIQRSKRISLNLTLCSRATLF